MYTSKTPPFPSLLIFLINFLLLSSNAIAQETTRFEEWLDDEHYIVSLSDNGASSKYQKVQAKTGKITPYEMPVKESLSDNLPDGVSLRWGNHVYNSDRSKVIIQKDNDLHLFEKGAKETRQLTGNEAEEKNPRFSPDGKYVAYTRDHNLYVLNTETGLERQLTTDGSDLIYNGWASWVYYEEILGRGSRYRAFYWSPDSKKIAFLRFDDNPVPEFPIFHHIHGDGVHGELEVMRYPKSGDPNPIVELKIANIETGEITTVEKDESMEYTAWVFWTPDATQLFYQQMNRNQNVLHLNAADPKTGASKRLHVEKQSTWLTFYEDIHFLKDNKGFILLSDRDGWRNLYHHQMDGRLVRNLTPVGWRVSGIEKIDEKAGKIWFFGTRENPTGLHFFSVNMDGKNLKQLTKSAGRHRVELSSEGSYFVDQFSNFETPLVETIVDNKGKVIREIYKNTEDRNKEAGVKVEHFIIKTEDGWELPAYWVLPVDFDENKKYPVLFSVYGGPNSGGVSNSYRNFSNSSLVKNGGILFSVDHRGSGKFGKKGLDYMHRNLGKWEMHDYIEAVKWLRKKPFIDENRIGIQGGSYGGYMACMALTYGADYFTHGVANYSVTDWRLYDNIYTERYMDTPEDNPEGYEFGSVMTHADNLKGQLLIIHGTIDDNVHMQNSIQLVSKLQDLGKDFDFMVYPGGRHGWGGAKRQHSQKMIREFWEKFCRNE